MTKGNGLLYVLLGLFIRFLHCLQRASWRAPRPILLRSPTRRPCLRRIPRRSRTRPSIPGAPAARMPSYALLCMTIRSYAPLCVVMRSYADLCSRVRCYSVVFGRMCGSREAGSFFRLFPPFSFLHKEKRPAKVRGRALSRGDRDEVYLTAGCQRMKRRSSSVTARSMTSAKAVRTRIPAITVFMSKVVSACRIR